MFTLDKVWDIVHWTRTIERIHGDKVFKHSWMKLTKVLLHTSRLKLESTNGLSTLIELVGQFVINRNLLKVNHVASRLLNNLASLLQLGESLQSEEVHFDKTSRLNYVTIILGYWYLLLWEVWVCSRRDRYPFINRVTTDNESTGMDTRSTHCSLQHLGVFNRITLPYVFTNLCILQLWGTLDSIR